jgi:hypothetical protein
MMPGIGVATGALSTGLSIDQAVNGSTPIERATGYLEASQNAASTIVSGGAGKINPWVAGPLLAWGVSGTIAKGADSLTGGALTGGVAGVVDWLDNKVCIFGQCGYLKMLGERDR